MESDLTQVILNTSHVSTVVLAKIVILFVDFDKILPVLKPYYILYMSHIEVVLLSLPPCLHKSLVQLLKIIGLFSISLYLGIGIDVTTVTLSSPFLTSPIYLKFVPYPENNLFMAVPGFNVIQYLSQVYVQSWHIYALELLEFYFPHKLQWQSLTV